MATNENTHGGVGMAIKNTLTIVMTIVTIVVLLGIGYTFLPSILATPLPAMLTLPTATVAKPAPAAPRVRAPALPAAAPVQPAIDAYNATATAQYNDAVNAAQAQPVPNVGQGEPVVIGQRVNEIQPAEDNVSVSEPVDDTHGSKLTAPVNPQVDHQCLHGQVWTDSGCHRPTPVK